MNSSPEAQERAPNATAPYLEATDGRLAETDPADTRFILYERWKGEEARRKAGSPEPQGAGMARAAAEKIEYAEVWGSEDPSDGYDLRVYSFGGNLIACFSTRRPWNPSWS